MKLGKLSRKATAAAVGGVLALTGVGVSAAAVLSPTSTAPASDSSEVTEPAASSAEPTAEPTQAAPVVEQPEQAAPTSTVPGVTSTQQPAPPAQAPANDGVGTTGDDGRYTPAPPVQRPGEPPVGDLSVGMHPAEPLPGEPGYVPPTG